MSIHFGHKTQAMYYNLFPHCWMLDFFSDICWCVQPEDKCITCIFHLNVCRKLLYATLDPCLIVRFQLYMSGDTIQHKMYATLFHHSFSSNENLFKRIQENWFANASKTNFLVTLRVRRFNLREFFRTIKNVSI